VKTGEKKNLGEWTIRHLKTEITKSQIWPEIPGMPVQSKIL